MRAAVPWWRLRLHNTGFEHLNHGLEPVGHDVHLIIIISTLIIALKHIHQSHNYNPSPTTSLMFRGKISPDILYFSLYERKYFNNSVYYVLVIFRFIWSWTNKRNMFILCHLKYHLRTYWALVKEKRSLKNRLRYFCRSKRMP